jgi:hypothetical protein
LIITPGLSTIFRKRYERSFAVCLMLIYAARKNLPVKAEIGSLGFFLDDMELLNFIDLRTSFGEHVS